MERGGGLVLVCDDTEPIRRLIRMNLELDGYAVEEATDGESLLARLWAPGAELPGVIILVAADLRDRPPAVAGLHLRVEDDHAGQLCAGGPQPCQQ